MSNSFQQSQRRFAAWVRDPDTQPVPEGIERRRLAIYRELVYGNIEGFLRNGFPVLYSLVDAGVWKALVTSFVAEHACESPYFVDISRHFVEFLQQRPDWQAKLPAWALELSHYEWMEVVIDMAEAPTEEFAGVDPSGDLMAQAPVLSPLACLLGYRWPVHQLCTEFVPDAPPDEVTWLVIYRDVADEVKFMEVNAVTAALLQSLEQSPDSNGTTHLRQLAVQSGLPEQTALEAGAGMLARLRQKGVLLGTRRNTA